MTKVVLSLGLLLAAVPSNAQDMIEVGGPAPGAGGPTPAVVSAEDVFGSPVYVANRDAIIEEARERIEEASAVDPELRDLIVGELDELPFHRVLDIELAFLSGFPDTVGLCIEGHPTNPLAIEACVSATIFFGSVSANLKYRWDLVLHRNRHGKIHQLSLGPGFGARLYRGCFLSCAEGAMIEAMGSLEYVFWITRHFGLTAQLDLGAGGILYTTADTDTRVYPMGKLTIGVAF